MSYIRYGQSGQYVDIPEGSQYYIYSNGNSIVGVNGWSYEEFAAMIGGVADELDIPDEHVVGIKASFRAHFEGWDPDYRGGIDRPERAEIFCQCVDKRIEQLKLTDTLHDAVQEWVEEQDVYVECKFCGDEFRKRGDNNICWEGECVVKGNAKIMGIEPRILKNENHLFYELTDNYGWGTEEATKAAEEYVQYHQE